MVLQGDGRGEGTCLLSFWIHGSGCRANAVTLRAHCAILAANLTGTARTDAHILAVPAAPESANPPAALICTCPTPRYNGGALIELLLVSPSRRAMRCDFPAGSITQLYRTLDSRKLDDQSVNLESIAEHDGGECRPILDRLPPRWEFVHHLIYQPASIGAIIIIGFPNYLLPLCGRRGNVLYCGDQRLKILLPLCSLIVSPIDAKSDSGQEQGDRRQYSRPWESDPRLFLAWGGGIEMSFASNSTTRRRQW